MTEVLGMSVTDGCISDAKLDPTEAAWSDKLSVLVNRTLWEGIDGVGTIES